MTLSSPRGSSHPQTRARRTGRRAFSLITLALAVVVGSGVFAAARSDKWWWDNLGGPSSSHYTTLDQINKTNLDKLEVAWFYPYGNPGFSPVVVEDMLF